MADEMTPESNCIEGTSESISELLHVSNEFLSVPLLAHHGDIKPPSDAVSYDEECE